MNKFLFLLAFLLVFGYVSGETALDNGKVITGQTLNPSGNATFRFYIPSTAVPNTGREGAELLFSLDFASSAYVTLYVSHAVPPNTTAYDSRQKPIFSDRASITISNVQTGDYYLLATIGAVGSPVSFSIFSLFSCPTGYTPAAGTTLTCEACPTNAEVDEFGGYECVCKEGFYSRPNVSLLNCYACPEGAYCGGGSSLPVSNRGWFQVGQFTGADHEDSFFFECPNEDTCGIGNECIESGYEGRGCAECEEGYFRLITDCVKCYPGAIAVFIVGILHVFALWMCFFPLAKIYKYLPSAMSVVNFLQVLGLFGYFRLGWPKLLRYTFYAFSAFNLNVELLSPECAGELKHMPYYVKWALIFLFPPVWAFLTAHVFILFPLYFVIARILNFPVVLRMYMPDIFAYFISVLLTLTHYLYLPYARLVFEMVDCTRLPNNEWYLDADFGEQCWTSVGHYVGLGMALAMFLVYIVGIPVLYGVLLFVGKQRLHTNPFTIRRIGIIYYKYRPHFFWWELFIILQKLGLAISSTMVTQHTLYQAVIGLSVIGVGLAGQLLFNPQKRFVLNVVDAILLSCEFIILFAGLIFYSAKNPNDYALSAVVVGLLVVVVASFVFLLSGEGLWWILLRRKRRLEDPHLRYVETKLGKQARMREKRAVLAEKRKKKKEEKKKRKEEKRAEKARRTVELAELRRVEKEKEAEERAEREEQEGWEREQREEQERFEREEREARLEEEREVEEERRREEAELRALEEKAEQEKREEDARQMAEDEIRERQERRERERREREEANERALLERKQKAKEREEQRVEARKKREEEREKRREEQEQRLEEQREKRDAAYAGKLSKLKEEQEEREAERKRKAEAEAKKGSGDDGDAGDEGTGDSDERPKARALFNYRPMEADELSVNVGDKLRIVDFGDGTWYEADLNGTVGMVPANYLEVEGGAPQAGGMTSVTTNTFQPQPAIGDVVPPPVTATTFVPPPPPSAMMIVDESTAPSVVPMATLPRLGTDTYFASPAPQDSLPDSPESNADGGPPPPPPPPPMF